MWDKDGYLEKDDETKSRLQEIKETWESEELWQEKQDVFDFMNKHFDFLLQEASKGL